MNSYTPVPDPVTPEWLTAALRQSGALSQGQVAAVQTELTDAFNSHTSRLRVRYSAEVAPQLPDRLVLKRNTQAEWSKEAGTEEVKFYRLIAAQPVRPRLYVPCLAAEVDEVSGDSYLLLQDVSDTHAPPISRDQQLSIVNGVPAAAQIHLVVDALAQHHAVWWEHALLGTDTFHVGYWLRNLERLELYLARRTRSWATLLAGDGDWLPDEVRALYTRVLAALPAYWQRHVKPRFQARTGLTLIHGDAYFSNFLCPRQVDAADAHAYLLDWQSPSFDIGGHDLVNLLASFWTQAQRREDEREVHLLRRYLDQLQAGGVKNYTWDDLVLDYQHGLIFWLLMPVQDGADGSGRAYWWPKMQCLIQAFRDWNCEALLTQ